MQFTQKVDYGLLLLKALSSSTGPSPRSIAAIAEEYGVSFSFLQKVAGILKRSGLITATRGKAGGYILSREPEAINLKEVIEILDGPVTLMPCQSKHSQCPRTSSCTVRPAISSLNAEIQELLLKRTLKSFV